MESKSLITWDELYQAIVFGLVLSLVIIIGQPRPHRMVVRAEEAVIEEPREHVMVLDPESVEALKDTEEPNEYEPFLVDTTAYCHGTVCCRGEKPREGIVAGTLEWYGMACVIYEAIPDGNGGYTIGEVLDICEVLDTGYGLSTGDGIPSKIRSDKDSRGTIEVGECIDKYCENLDMAREWMRLTGGKVFIQIMPADG